MSVAMGSADSGYDPDAFNGPVSEYDLMREVIFAHQGLNGKIIRQDHTNGGRFVITPAYVRRINPTQRTMMERLTNSGWLLHKIKSYISFVSKDPSHGRVAQNLAAALNGELFEYYSVITQIEQQLQKMDSVPHVDAYGSALDIYQQPPKSMTVMSTRTRASTPTSDGYQNPLALAKHMNGGGVLNALNGHHLNPAHNNGAFNNGCGPGSSASNFGGYNSLQGVYPLKGPTHSATFDCLRSCSNGYLNRDVDAKSSSDDGLQSLIQPSMSLHMIYSWSFDYYFRIKTLAMLVDCARAQRGGHLAMIVHKFMQQGDKSIKCMITRILGQVVLPIRNMLCQWIFHGEIIDPHKEFFICVDQDDPTQNTFKINPSMMPGFISKLQASKILVTGKAIHLLRRVCNESIGSSVPRYEDLKKSFESTSIESLFKSQASLYEENEFQHLLDTAYKEVSQKALKLLFDNYNLMSHFRALRRYLLLGQGDFIRHLMDLLEEELDKPASEVRFHNIIPVLESAIRSTNAKYDNPDITNRLDCKLPDTNNPNACGWDTFILIYEVDGPISTIFTPDRIADYVKLFRQLWKAKRIEHILTSLWSSQMFYSKATRGTPGVSSIFHRANILLSEMMHFMQHFQDFVMFEVMECSWRELEEKFQSAQDIDELISAHDTFLKKAKLGVLCQNDAQSEALNKQLFDLFNCSIVFRDLMASLWKAVDSMTQRGNVDQTFNVEINRESFVKQLSSLSARYHTGIARFLEMHNLFACRYVARTRSA